MQETFGLDSLLVDIEEKHKNKDVVSLINLSSKCQFLFSLMDDLKKNGHRLLIFSLSKKMLNLIEDLIGADPKMKENFKYLRIDGDTEINSREGLCV
jgi:SNF2 family DNA or RNA helicase